MVPWKPLLIIGALAASFIFVRSQGGIGKLSSGIGSFIGGGINSAGAGLAYGFTGGLLGKNTTGGLAGTGNGVAGGNTNPNAGDDTTPKSQFNTWEGVFNFLKGLLNNAHNAILPDAAGYTPPTEIRASLVKSLSYPSSQQYAKQVLKANTGGYNYGGYGSAQTQREGLVKAIASSALAHPEWFR